MPREKTATVDLKVRMKEPLRARLEAAAKDKGISMNAETVARLEHSFDRQDLLLGLLDLAYGKPIAGLLQLLGQAMKNTANRQAHRSAHDPVAPGDEILVPEAMDQALNAAQEILAWARAAAAEPSAGNLGQVVSFGLLDWIEGHSGPDRTGWSAEITERLAPLIGKVPSKTITMSVTIKGSAEGDGQ